MFVYYFAHAQIPLALAEERLLGRLDRLESWAGDAYRDGERIAAGFRVAAGVLSKQVRLRVWPVTRTDDVVIMRVSWEAAGAPALFPKLDADLVLAALGPDLTQVALRGSYLPPLGRVGEALDRTLLHRVAEASVKEFVDMVVEDLAVERAANAPG